MRNILKKIALSVTPIKKVHLDLENRRRRVAELEGHLRIMKKQMAKALNHSNSISLSGSQSSSDINHVKGELKKLTSQHKTLENKYKALYRDYCILSMSNEALTETNASILNGDFFETDKASSKPSTKAKAPPKATRKRTIQKTPSSSKTPTSTRKRKPSAKANQK